MKKRTAAVCAALAAFLAVAAASAEDGRESAEGIRGRISELLKGAEGMNCFGAMLYALGYLSERRRADEGEIRRLLEGGPWPSAAGAGVAMDCRGVNVRGGESVQFGDIGIIGGGPDAPFDHAFLVLDPDTVFEKPSKSALDEPRATRFAEMALPWRLRPGDLPRMSECWGIAAGTGGRTCGIFRCRVRLELSSP